MMNSATLTKTLAGLGVVALCACGSDDTSNNANNTNNTNNTNTTPLYAVTSEINTGDEYQSYVMLTDSLTATQQLDVSDAIELPGRARGVGPAGGGLLFTSGDEAPTLTKWTLGSDDTLTQGDTLSFAPRGVQSISEYQSQFHFVSETKAYYFDPGTFQAIIWNPETMELSGTIDLADLEVADALMFYSQTPATEVNGKLYYAAGWLTADRTGALTRSAMIVVDTAADTAEVVIDERCAWARDGVRASDGYIYLATEAYAGAVYHLDDTATREPCMVRFDPATDTYDDTFLVDLDDVVDPGNDGDVAGMLLPGSGDKAFLRVLDPSLVGPPPVPIVVSVRPYWSWYEITLGDAPTGSPIDSMPVSAGRNLLLDVGDRQILPLAAGDPVTTSLLDLTGGTLGDAETTVEGQVFSMTKLR